MIPAIEAENLRKRYVRMQIRPPFVSRDGAEAVKGVSFVVEEGEVFGIVGPNGAGKTTLVKMLCTLLSFTSGQARIHGHDVLREGRAVKRLLGLVAADERSFYWRLTGRQNLQFFAAIHDLSGKERDRRIEELCELLDVVEKLDDRFDQYSTGTRQKLAIVRGLLTMPRVLFMDEPTKGLDPVSAHDFAGLIRSRVIGAYGGTILLTTHIMSEAEKLCDRLAIMVAGQVVAAGTPAALRLGEDRSLVYHLSAENVQERALESLARLSGVERIQVIAQLNGNLELGLTLSKQGRVLNEVLRLLIESGSVVRTCTKTEPSFEEVMRNFMVQVPAPGEGAC